MLVFDVIWKLSVAFVLLIDTFYESLFKEKNRSKMSWVWIVKNNIFHKVALVGYNYLSKLKKKCLFQVSYFF